MRVKTCVRAECRPRVDLLDERRAGREREQLGQVAPHRVADRDRAVAALDADVDVQAEGVVAPDHVLQQLVVPAVVRRVDDPLVLPAAPTGACRSRRAARPARARARAAARGARPIFAAASPKSAHLPVRTSTSDAISSPTRCGSSVGAARRRLEVLEAVDQLERAGVEDRELLLDREREVGRRSRTRRARTRAARRERASVPRPCRAQVTAVARRRRSWRTAEATRVTARQAANGQPSVPATRRVPRPSGSDDRRGRRAHSRRPLARAAGRWRARAGARASPAGRRRRRDSNAARSQRPADTRPRARPRPRRGPSGARRAAGSRSAAASAATIPNASGKIDGTTDASASGSRWTRWRCSSGPVKSVCPSGRVRACCSSARRWSPKPTIDRARVEAADRVEQQVHALVHDQLPEVDDDRAAVGEERREPFGVALVRQPLVRVAGVRRVGARLRRAGSRAPRRAAPAPTRRRRRPAAPRTPARPGRRPARAPRGCAPSRRRSRPPARASRRPRPRAAAGRASSTRARSRAP